MNDNNKNIQEYFNQIGGALYSTVGMLSVDPQDVELNTSKLVWILLTEAVARIKEPENILPWFYQQLNAICMLDPEIKEYFDNFLDQHINFYIPFLLFVKGENAEDLWEEINRTFPSSQQEISALRLLLFTLFINQPEYLFTNDHWRYELPNPEEYASPDVCSVAKLGQTLKYLIENCPDKEVNVYTNWREILGSKVLKVLPQKIKPGFAEESPLFESLVFSLLHTSALLTQKNINSVREYLKDSLKNPLDIIAPDQLILIGSLYGLVTKYEKNSSWINDLEQRRLLSGQALSLSLSLDTSQQGKISITDPIVFYSTRSGNLYDFCTPFLKVLKREYNQIEHFSEGIYKKSWGYLVNVGGAFQLEIDHETDYFFRI